MLRKMLHLFGGDTPPPQPHTAHACGPSRSVWRVVMCCVKLPCVALRGTLGFRGLLLFVLRCVVMRRVVCRS